METKDTFFVARDKESGKFLRVNRELGRFFVGELYEAESWYHLNEEEVQQYLEKHVLSEQYEVVLMGPLEG